ncbi:MAG TPA: MlaD family protein [Candidatus Binataceae bacterium]|nr:MlaD family protein [Candidatus Binataceae bacterium]
MGKKVSARFIGMFVLGALALALLMVVVLGSRDLFRKTYKYVLFFDGSVNGLRVGALVKMRGVPVGSVDKILLSLGGNLADVRNASGRVMVPVIVNLEVDMIKSAAPPQARQLSDDAFIPHAVSRGLRGQLANESFVTGILYISLDMYPGTTANLMLPQGAPYQEIPTIPTPLQQAQQVISDVMEKLEQVDFPALITSLNATLVAVKDFAGSPQMKAATESLKQSSDNLSRAADSIRVLADDLHHEIKPISASVRTASDNAARTLEQANKTLVIVQDALEPGSPLAYQLNTTLNQVSAAAQSMKELTDLLDRNPSALVRGTSSENSK